MRKHETYRSSLRNMARVTVNAETKKKALRYWRFLNVAAEANAIAKLAERRKTCAGARRAIVMLKIRHLARKLAEAEVNKTLLNFWRKQKQSRVNFRIVHELTMRQTALA